MTISKFRGWGEQGALPPEGVVVGSDAGARALITAARRANTEPPPIGLTGGDLCRTLGGTGDLPRLHSVDAIRLPVDIGAVLLDGRIHWFVAHMVARNSWWHGRVVGVMNAEFIGNWDVAPRSHPNDGLLDVFDASMSVSDRLKARTRLRSGTHVPHPDISQERSSNLQLEFDRPTAIYLDGEMVGKFKTALVRVEQDAVICVV